MDADTTNLITVFCAFYRQLQIFYLQNYSLLLQNLPAEWCWPTTSEPGTDKKNSFEKVTKNATVQSQRRRQRAIFGGRGRASFVGVSGFVDRPFVARFCRRLRVSLGVGEWRHRCIRPTGDRRTQRHLHVVADRAHDHIHMVPVLLLLALALGYCNYDLLGCWVGSAGRRVVVVTENENT